MKNSRGWLTLIVVVALLVGSMAATSPVVADEIEPGEGCWFEEREELTCYCCAAPAPICICA